jgi:FKBP-type peptidyl-prolyl cis-trans isomerase FkpA
MRVTLFLTVLIGLFGLTSCEKQTEKDRELILEYIAENNLDATETEEGLFYVIEVEGTGASPSLTDEVEVHYEGFFLNGDKFDSSIDRAQTATFPLLGVIMGWQLGLPFFKEGGRGKLLVPSHLGYGRQGTASGSIPPNSVLVFDIQLFDVL